MSFVADREALHHRGLGVPEHGLRDAANLPDHAAQEPAQVHDGHAARPVLPEHERLVHVAPDVRPAQRSARAELTTKVGLLFIFLFLVHFHR